MPGSKQPRVSAAAGRPLASYLGADVSPLQQLDRTIQSDSTRPQAAHDFRTIFSSYRVYVLVVPAARLAADADRATSTALSRFNADASEALSRVTARNQGTLQPLIDDLDSQISTATTATAGLATAVLAFTPAQWDQNSALLAASQSLDQAALGALRKARTDATRIAQELRLSSHTASSTAAT